jgi:hypothetical protein
MSFNVRDQEQRFDLLAMPPPQRCRIDASASSEWSAEVERAGTHSEKDAVRPDRPRYVV